MEDFIMSQPSINGVNASILNKVTMTALVAVFIVLALCLIISLCVRWCMSGTEITFLVSWGRRGPPSRVATRRRGLDRATLRTLPLVVYDPKDFKEELECSVCLSETLQGDVIRVLPKCNHGFHLECIDMWFKSHSTCPLCRNVVSVSSQNQSGNFITVDETEISSDSDSNSSTSNSDSDSESDNEGASMVHLGVALAFPTNVLFWGNEGQVRSFGEATTSSSREELVIDIPRDVCDGGDGLSSPPSMVVSRLSSLKRLLSGGC
ncbi:hypothetical protein vseg_010280 [Gypsophila vaccaria]